MNYKCYVALFTPFTLKNDIDYHALEKMIERLLNQKCSGFIVCGTTGESSTLTENEKIDLLDFVIQKVNHRAEIYFGIGSNNTCVSMRLLKLSEMMDFEGYLIVTPYYNKPSQYGLYEHYATLAGETKKKIMIYNVPSRTGVAISANTVIKLAHNFENIVALKQASSDFEMVRYILNELPDFLIYSGNDDLILEGLNIGMKGVVSVIGHLMLPEMIQLLECYERHEDVSALDELCKRMSSIVFLESNPICLKYLLSKEKSCENVLRLPMSVVSEENRILIDALL